MEVEEQGDKKYLTEEERWLIVIASKYFHLTQKEISERFNFQQSTISRYLQRYNETGSIEYKFSNCGRNMMIEEYPQLPELIRHEMVELKQKYQQIQISQQIYNILEMEVEEQGDKKYLTEEERWLIVIASKYFHLTQKEISERFNFQQSTISRYLQRYNETGSIEYKFSNCGRNMMIEEYPQLPELIRHEMVEDHQIKSRQISYNLENKNGIEVSHQTVCKILNNQGFNYDRIKICHKLTEYNKNQRIQYINEISKSKKLNKYIYSDESIFSIDKFNSFQWVNGQEITGIYEKKENQYQNRYSHVWAGISLSGRTDLYFHTSKVDSDAYIECLNQSLLSYKKQMKIRGYVYLVQDGAPSHTSQKTQDNCDNEKIKIIQLPPWSPDLNPMELIWNIMKCSFKKQVTSKQFQTKKQIETCLQTIWRDEITQEQVINCINHVSVIMPHIIELNGEYKN
ncbi:hypothetical protein ABPG72_019939 [Tetrahymena utriculariae]